MVKSRKQTISEIEGNIQDLSVCYAICMNTIRYCLEMGGKHAEPQHLLLLLDCADICQVTSNFMYPTSNAAKRTAELCSQICDKCAESCEKFKDDEQMKMCADICRRCANSCREMSKMEAMPS